MRLRTAYEPAAYAEGSLAGCYWETTCPAPEDPQLDGDLRADVAVVGAGVTGLNAALDLAAAGADVVVIDRHPVGWGASGRNGGFACVGGTKLGRAAMLRRHGAGDRARWCGAEVAAVATVAERIETLGLKVDRHSDGEVMLAHSPRAMADMRSELPLLVAEYGVAPELLEPEDLAARGLGAAGMHGGVRLPVGFALNPRKYVLGLAAAARAAGVRIRRAEVLTLDDDGLVTALGRLGAGRVILTTNGYGHDAMPPGTRALPVTSSVLVTRPLTETEVAAQGWSSDLMAYDSRDMLHYFRLLPERRLLFGMRGGVRWTPAAHARLRRQMQADLVAMFPAWAGVETSFFWSGLACLTGSLTPFCGPVGEKVFAAYGYHGNGVAMGSWCGRQVAAQALGRATPDLPGFMGTTPPRLPPGRFRRLGLRAAYGWYGLKERLGA